MDFEKIINDLSVEELVGQTMCLFVNPEKTSLEDFEKKIKEMQPGGIYLSDCEEYQANKFIEVANKCLKVPLIVTTDAENGTQVAVKGGVTIPLQMGVGACDDVELVEEAWHEIARVSRVNGFHWGFNPVVDINFNFRSPECNVRSFSDRPEHVIKMTSATLKGYRKDGLQACTLKHFPGQGIDERNSHFVTTVNTLSKRQWMKTYGKVYRELFKQGVDSVMIGHIALPAFETEKDELGYLPATISKSLMTGLLKGKLGFKGVVISDALSMVGLATRHPLDELPLLFLQAGGDMVLFPHQEGCDKVVEAVKNGSLSVERVKDAVRRILKLKENVHLFEPDYFKDLKPAGNIKELALKIAQKSVTKIRDFNNLLGEKFEKGTKILMVNLIKPFFPKELTGEDFAPLKKELEANGMIVTSIDNADYNHINKIKDDFDVILISSKLSSDNYDGGSQRIDWEIVMTFWDGYIMDHPKVIFVSFGDPYKIFDVPYAKTYINAYSQFPETQIAVARAVIGLEKFTGKSPVRFEGFFERQV